MNRLRELYYSYIDDALTPAELEEFWGLVRRAAEDDPVMEAIFQEYEKPLPAGGEEGFAGEGVSKEAFPGVNWDRAMERILAAGSEGFAAEVAGVGRGAVVPMELDAEEADGGAGSGSPGRSFSHSRRRWIAAAAAVLLVLVGGGLLYRGLHGGRGEGIVKTGTGPLDLPPGHNGAVLTLAEGQQIVLDSMGNGNVAQQSGMTVVKIDGRLAYHRDGEQAVAVTYNTLTVPRGRQFELVLPDSTRVWLNSASSLRFPTAFVGGVREVSLTGEAYFEVKSNARAPFRVSIGGQQIEVLGTAFNINGYEDESGVRTTLVEGSVQVRRTGPGAGAGTAAVRLSPGQQAQMDGQGKVNLSKADVEDVLAWKEGWFRFSGQPVEPIMRQLSRWYDVDVLYEGTPPATRIGGEVPRNMQLSKVLDALRISGVNLEMKDGKIVVRP